jgi:hypothetical protein
VYAAHVFKIPYGLRVSMDVEPWRERWLFFGWMNKDSVSVSMRERETSYSSMSSLKIFITGQNKKM